MRWTLALAIGCTPKATTVPAASTPAAPTPVSAASTPPAPTPISAASTPPAPTPTPAAAPPAPSLPTISICPLAGIDWCTRDYGDELSPMLGGLSVAGGWNALHLYDCEDTPFAGEHSTTLKRVVGATTGDLDGDGTDEIVLMVTRESWTCGQRGPWRHTVVAAYALRAGSPVALGAVGLDVVPAAPPTVTAGVARVVGADGCTQALTVAGGRLAARAADCP